MDSSQRLPFIVFTLIAGGLLVLLVLDIDFENIGGNVQDQIAQEEVYEYDQVNIGVSLGRIIQFWETYQHTDQPASFTMHVQGNRTLDKTLFFDYIKGHNLCDSIQSRAYDCGEREDVHIESIELPAVVSVHYKNQSLWIRSRGERRTQNRSTRYKLVPLPSYAGEGALTRRITDLPSNMSVSAFRLKIASGADMQLLINNEVCRERLSTHQGGTSFDLANCSALLQPGTNNISLSFYTPNLFRKHLTGGYLLLVYHAPQPLDAPGSTEVMPITGMNGTIKLSDALNLRSSADVTFDLHFRLGTMYENNLTLRVGNNSLYTTGSPGEYTVSPSISGLSPGTQPFKLSVAEEKKLTKDIELPKPVDVILITDLSNSMLCDTDNFHPQDCKFTADNGTERSCSNSNLLADTTQKLSLAKCFGRDFAEIILDTHDENEVGLVSFGSSTANTLGLTDLFGNIQTRIGFYNAGPTGTGGGTCISCAIKSARSLMSGSGDNKVIALMSDGKATHCLPATTSCSTSVAGNEARDQAYLAAQDNISLYSIGFAMQTNEGKQLLEDIACYDNCSHYEHGDNATAIADIYDSFAAEIANVESVYVRYTQGYEQINWTPSTLYNDSSITISYSGTPSMGNPGKALVSLPLSTPGDFLLPENMSVEMARVGAWSHVYWTDHARLNGNTIFDLGSYASDYRTLGDPFFLRLPPIHLKEGENHLEVTQSTVQGERQYPEGIELFYRVRLNDSAYSSINPSEARGCHWTVHFSEGSRKFTLPRRYKGEETCRYSPDTVQYNPDDLHQLTAHRLFSGLDRDDDGVVDSPLRNVHLLGGPPDI